MDGVVYCPVPLPRHDQRSFLQGGPVPPRRPCLLQFFGLLWTHFPTVRLAAARAPPVELAGVVLKVGTEENVECHPCPRAAVSLP